jgi:hypothetical protein
MFQLDTAKAMRMNETLRDMNNAMMSMAHHPTLGIVTIDSFKNRDQKDTTPIADNPPVAGAAGASDPQIAAVVRGIRDRLLPLVSPDRTQTSGIVDATKFNDGIPGAQFITGLAARAAHRNKTR